MPPASTSHSYDSRPQDHWEAAQQADKVVVFGMSARPTGISVPNELIAEYVASRPEKLIGWASVNPADDDAIDQLDHCVTDLGLSGLKIGPTYQHFDPTDRSYWPFFRRCSELGIPDHVAPGHHLSRPAPGSVGRCPCYSRTWLWNFPICE